jgi:hypothetical protein
MPVRQNGYLIFPEILRKHDNAEVAVIHNRPTLEVMKTTFTTKDCLIPLLGMILVAGTLVVATSYYRLTERTQDAETLSATLGHLYEDQQLSLALKSIHDGQVQEAARRLDLLLCNHILRTDSELDSADPRARMFVTDAFRRIALVRPNTAAGQAAGSGQEVGDCQAAAEKILTRALGSAQTAQVR